MERGGDRDGSGRDQEREIGKLSQEERQKLIRELLPSFCHEMMGKGNLMEEMMSRCMGAMEGTPMQGMMQKMMGQKRAEEK